MKNKSYRITLRILLSSILVFVPGALLLEAADLSAETVKAWNSYVKATEARISKELSSKDKFLALEFQPEDRVNRELKSLFAGEIPITEVKSVDANGREIEVPDGMMHHWRGSVFIPNIALDAVYARVANPSIEDTRQEDVLDSAVLERNPDSLKLYLKLQRSKIITVVYNTEHQVRFQRPNANRAWSRSMATKIAEIENPHSDNERERPEGHDRGFLWRMNSYWRYKQVEGGVIVECESITLSRSIPAVIKYFVNPLIKKVARESMNRTLDSMRNRLSRASAIDPSITSVRFDGGQSATMRTP
jgi:hypothetical protein